ncbi:MAG: hypothetical protein ABFS14_11945 [Gemmatimonadota bacterium]
MLELQAGDGAWGAYPDRPSATEPTSLALMSLQASGRTGEARRRAADWLVSWQREDGSWPVSAQTQSAGWSTSFAVMALAGEGGREEAARRGARWLVREKGRGLPWLTKLYFRFFPNQQSVNVLDPSLVGWPWATDTFSWVEPTAYAMIALRRLPADLRPRGSAGRLDMARRMLADRMCYEGGWNYGNKEVLGENLWPYADTTALALVALGGPAADESVSERDQRLADVRRLSLDALGRMLERNRSGIALAWSILCYRLYSLESAQLERWLADSYAQTGFLDETRVVATAALALAGGEALFRDGGA